MLLGQPVNVNLAQSLTRAATAKLRNKARTTFQPRAARRRSRRLVRPQRRRRVGGEMVPPVHLRNM